ncbi:hypothetical protein K438DRAFT_375481 [Mycena galopus ATCC 62051]|nr:hypothetical protein K438DRAFT_375481 [Mycena galopus ATCC 62051]
MLRTLRVRLVSSLKALASGFSLYSLFSAAPVEHRTTAESNGKRMGNTNSTSRSLRSSSSRCAGPVSVPRGRSSRLCRVRTDRRGSSRIEWSGSRPSRALTRLHSAHLDRAYSYLLASSDAAVSEIEPSLRLSPSGLRSLPSARPRTQGIHSPAVAADVELSEFLHDSAPLRTPSPHPRGCRWDDTDARRRPALPRKAGVAASPPPRRRRSLNIGTRPRGAVVLPTSVDSR